MLKFIIKKHALQLLAAILVFGGLLVAAFYRPQWHTSIAWLESIAGLGTLVFAGFVWLNGIRNEWESSLPKRLTAYFRFDAKDVMVFRNILLLNESDARAWAQQIARQKADKDVQFEPYFKFTDNGVVYDKTPFKSYEIIFYLTDIPEKLKSKISHNINGQKWEWYLEWRQVDNPDGTISILETPMQSERKMS